MKPADHQPLVHECAVFARYLVGSAPSPYVLEKYLHAHEKSSAYLPSGFFDRALVRFAAQGGRRTRLADSYACLLARKSALRKKLVLLSAILESCAPSHEIFDSVDANPRLVLLARLAGAGVLFLAHLLTALALFGPLQLSQSFRGRASKEPTDS